LIVAAAGRDPGGVAAIVLFGLTDRVDLTGKHRHANRADDNGDEDESRQLRASSLHAPNLLSRDRANGSSREARVFPAARARCAAAVGK
jgi:hypothetical protein